MAASLQSAAAIAARHFSASPSVTSTKQSQPSISSHLHLQPLAAPLRVFDQSTGARAISPCHVRRRVSALASADSAPASGSSGGESGGSSSSSVVLQSGTAIVVVAEPPFVKSAEPMPMLRRNDGLLRVGDAGRIIDRRPKDVWAVRFGHGAFLLDRKYFEPFEG